MEKIRVIHFVSGLRSGGVESMIANYAEMLKDEFEFTVVYQHKADEKCYHNMKNSGCKLIRIPSKKKHPVKNIISVHNLLKERKYDVVHSHMNLTSWIPLLIAKRNKINGRISHAHIAKDEGEGIGYRVFAGISKKMIQASANYFLACGKDAARYMYGKDFHEDDHHLLIKNAIDIEKFCFSEEIRKDYRKKFNIENKFVIGHIGRFTKQKNHSFLLDIFEEILNENEDAILWLIGSGELEGIIKKYSIEKNIGDKVMFFGNRNDIPGILQAMDVFVLPSLFEGFPVVAIEAQASGVNCLLADTIDNTCKIIDNVEFLPIDRGTVLWKKKILEMKNQTVQRELLWQNVKEHGYEIRQQADKLKNLYFRIKKKQSENIINFQRI